jgi:hypothetical protein
MSIQSTTKTILDMQRWLQEIERILSRSAGVREPGPSEITPGPWRWSRGVGNWELVGADQNRVLFRWDDQAGLDAGLVTGETLKAADAALIEAAPDLLAALDALVRACELPGDHCEVEQALPHAVAVLNRVRGA